MVEIIEKTFRAYWVGIIYRRHRVVAPDYHVSYNRSSRVCSLLSRLRQDGTYLREEYS